MLFGGFAPPAARQTSAVFFMYYAPQSFALLIGISIPAPITSYSTTERLKIFFL